MQTLIKRHHIILSLIVTAVGLSTCKKANKSSTAKTIDNFTNTKENSFKLNKCSPRNDSFYTLGSIYGNSFAEQEKHVNSLLDKNHFATDQSKTFDAVKQDLKEVLLATPIFISKNFFDSGAKVYLQNAQPSVCNQFEGKGFAPVGVQRIFSCWLSDGQYNGVVLGEGEANHTQVSLKESIRHDMLRAMTYFVFNRALAQKSTALVEKIKTRGAQMTAALNQDLIKKGLKAIPLNTDDAKNNEIKKLVMIEAIDSIYCSESTHASMKADFPQFFASFDAN